MIAWFAKTVRRFLRYPSVRGVYTYPMPRYLFTGLAAIWACCVATAGVVRAQGSRADFERAAHLHDKVADTVYRDRVVPHWVNCDRFWYRVKTARDRQKFMLVDAQQATRSPAFDHAQLRAAVSRALKVERGGSALPPDDALPNDIAQLALDDRLENVTFRVGNLRFRCDLKNYEVHEIRADSAGGPNLLPKADAPRASGGGEAETEIVFVNRTAHDVHVRWRDYEGRPRAYGVIKPDEARRQHTYSGHVWEAVGPDDKVLAVFVAEADARQALITATSGPAPAARPRSRGKVSPDGRWSVELRDHNVYLRSLDPERQVESETALTTNGTAQNSYQRPLEWSPDSSKLLCFQVSAAQEHTVYLIESSPPDQLEPKLHAFEYLKPGDSIANPRPRLFDLATKQLVPIVDDLFANPWSISELRWDRDSRRFTFLFNQRGHQRLRVIAVDAESGTASAIIDEASPTFIDYNSKLFFRPLDETDEILWMSERDGWNHLYLFDSRSGRLKNQITRGAWVVRKVEHVDLRGRQIWFYASGLRPEQDPYYLHLCRINFDGSEFAILTEGDGTHDVTFSPDRRYLLDKWSRVDQPPVTELRRASDGGLVCEVERADAESLFSGGWTMPERFAAKGRDGETEIYGILIRPSNFDPAKSYPVVEQIYAGPHGAHVPKAFGTLTSQHALAELGFVVVQIDGMGTNWRSKAFHDVCWRNLADAGFADRIAWMKAAAATRPWLDLSRVGIYGGSAGGQSALRALIDHHDFYKVAVADCGCHDNRMDKIWWNELWMGYPLGPHYEASSNAVQAHKLQGKLLLVVGELDRNVDPASTMQVVRALQKADKDFDLVIVAGAGHGAAETPYGSRRRMDFLVRHLHGREPRWEP